MIKRLFNNDKFTMRMFFGFFTPAMLSTLGWALSDMADAVVVSQKLGAVGLAAIALILPVYMINCAIVHGFGLGGSAHYSKLLGQGDKDGARKSFTAVCVVAMIVSILTAVLGLIFIESLLRILGTVKADGELYIRTYDYLKVLLPATPLFYLSNLLNYYLRNDESQKVAAFGSVTGNIVDICFNITLLVLVISCVCYFFYIRKTVLVPTNKLKNATLSLVENKLEDLHDFNIDIKTGDEFESLAGSFTYMAHELEEHIKDLSVITAEKERIGAELDIAKHIQASMLPCIFPAFPERHEIDIFATMDPAKEVGGDFYDFFMVDDRHLAIVMADVSGKGVPAALFMVIGKTLIKDHTFPDRDLGEVFTAVNNLLCEANSEGLFITAFEGVLDLVTGEFTFVNAGHEMPFICKAGGNFELYKIRAGFVLAGMEGMKYKAGTMQIDVGDKIFEYTDGVTEATNVNNELYGMARLGTILNKVKNGTPHDILPAVKRDIDEFVGEAPQFDDITMLCLEYKTKMEIKEDAQ